MIVVTVLHKDFQGEFVKVAYVKISEDNASWDFTDEAACVSACETAYTLTQNINGSWSKGRVFPDREQNYDYHPNVLVINPPKENELGKRSSMIGDLFEISDSEQNFPSKIYICSVFGFKKYE